MTKTEEYLQGALEALAGINQLVDYEGNPFRLENEIYEIKQAIETMREMYAVLSELEESCEYWSEYDVPLGIVDRIKAALSKVRVDK